MIELLSALLMVSGPLKGHIQIFASGFPDITLLCLIFLFLDMLLKVIIFKSFSIRKEASVVGFCMLLFLSWMAFSSIYTSSEFNYLTKFSMFLIPFFCFALPVFYREFDLEKFTKYLIIFSFLTCCIFLYFFPKWRLGLLAGQSFNLESLKTLYLGVGGLCALCIMTLFLKKTNLVIKWLLILFFGVTLFVSGARAPLVFLVLVLLILFSMPFAKALASKRVSIESLKLTIIGGLMLLAFSVFATRYAEKSEEIVKLLSMSAERIMLLVSNDQGASINTRYSHIDFSLDGINESPIVGHGLGSYSRNFHGFDGMDYPHNLFLEVGYELGFVGVVLISIPLLIGFITSLNGRSTYVFAVFFFLFLNSMKSFSYVENRQFFFFLGLTVSMVTLRGGEGRARGKVDFSEERSA
ncbi:O-antigen ligase family protein [Aliiglaciecola sp. CAU 1673]|uniref:O-antigen ligase family protein n=1 Tax=Aliiglaciecola sp. CAU 1673 TaxID=3032595 RepID=UPI0023DB417B|nr:O-antigen ligase family protein [Aliiglaciecola sp. CAU 1673]MDF2177502.1 O-antigen ligase family protein [Aliiglaciecola sp. CAU 1673]